MSCKEGQQAVRQAVLEMLKRGTTPKAHQLVAAVTDAAAHVVPTVVEFEIGKIYDRKKDIHARFGGQRFSSGSGPSCAFFVPVAA